MRLHGLLILLGLAGAACTQAPAPDTRARPIAAAERAPAAAPTLGLSTTLSPEARRGLAFAQMRCAACHAVTPGGISPNPDAPAFESVVNVPGLTAETLTVWLRTSHYYPEAMNFEIAPEEVDGLTRYMLTLRDAR
jgi:mono/diheme cytochrome c family protein